ncbi:InlB B-repeat-containing protein [Pseudolactococcus reticulitermitis]|uniref:MucBP domain-containing protein n=1 Tax=Pseudolactococcus reticulitermitis TaxID=2025039 RepID=A0A224X293_9LACT|nr:InlB B-repeat-containing protein [Lactococcus reticulitermitis]GAX48268.1 hypothetical protein RsY01_1884 [Lactococcus reticulitermitis]
MSYKNRSKIRQKLVSIFLGLSLVFNVFAPLTAVFAEDIAPPTVPVSSWHLLNSKNEVVSEENPVKVEEAYALQAEVHLQALEGLKLTAGDLYQLALPENSEIGTWSGQQETPKDLVNKLGKVVGSFTIQNQVILLSLNETVTGLDEVDVVIQTDAVLTTDVEKNLTQAVQVGDSSQNIAFIAATSYPEPTPELKPATKAKLMPRALSIDYSSQVVVNDWEILDSSGIPLSITNQGTRGQVYQLKFNWTLTPLSGTLNEGDTFSFNRPVSTPGGNWGATNYAWTNFTDSLGTVLGQWRIQSNKIEVVIGVNVTGQQSISAEFISGANAFSAACAPQGGDTIVSFGGIDKVINFKNSSSLSALGASDGKYLRSTSNTTATWNFSIGNKELRRLGESFGTAYDIQSSVYIEDVLNGIPTEFSLENRVYLPTDLSTGVLSGAAGALHTIPTTKITQNSGESYADFKNRLGVYQYGFYKDAFDQYTLVVYLGDMGSDGIRYSDLDANFLNTAVNNAINNGSYLESDRDTLKDFMTKTYGNENVIGGKVAFYMGFVTETYPQVATTTTIKNTAKITKSGISKDYSATGQLQVPSGSGETISSGSVGVYLADTDTNLPLAGTFKLQKQDGANWVDYNGNGSGPWTTDAANYGFVNAGSVGDGTYRFVQIAAPSTEYDLEHSPGYVAGVGVLSAPFTITSEDTAGKTVNVQNTKYKFNVIYAPGTQGDFTANTHTSRVINSMTPAFSGAMGTDGMTPKGKTGYTFTGWDPVVTDYVTETVTYTAQWAPIVYAINYEPDGGANPISNPINYTYGVGVTSFAPATGKIGYTFAGWYDVPTGGNPVTEISKTATGNKTLYARWTANKYDIIYHLAGGDNANANPENYTYDVGVASFEAATKTGYHFLGWYDAAEGGNLITNIPSTATGTKYLYAHWNYTITYELDGGVNGTNPTHYEFGTGVTSFENATKTGHTFLGWYDKASGGNKVASISATEKEDKILYAHWRVDDYAINYELDGGENDPANPDQYTYGIGVSNLEPAMKDGYIFLGWFDENDQEVTAISDTAMGTQTLYAHFKGDQARIEAHSIERTIKANTTYTWNHTHHAPVLYDEDGGVVEYAELWAIIDGKVYSETDFEELPVGVYKVTFTNRNPNLRFNRYSRLLSALDKEVTTETTVTILEAPEVPAPVTVRYVDQNGKEIKTATVYTGKNGDVISSSAPMIDGYELISLSDKINAVITDQAQTFSFVYKRTNATQPDQQGKTGQQLPATGQTLPTTGQQLPKTGDTQNVFNLMLGFILVALVSFLSWLKLGKRFAKEID